MTPEMSATISILGEDREAISYRKTLNGITSSVMSTILLQQIIYWWRKSGKPFYKFKEPCTHPSYKAGDSWTEELGFSRREFDTALKRIGFKRTAQNVKQTHNKLIEYWTTIDRKTWYRIHDENLGNGIMRLYALADSANTGSENPPLEEQEITQETTSETTSNKDCNGGNGYSPEFQNFWTVYPNHKEKKKAFRCWQKKLKDGVKPEVLTAAAQQYADQCAEQKTEEKFIKHASTFLGPDDPWEDMADAEPEVIHITRRANGIHRLLEGCADAMRENILGQEPDLADKAAGVKAGQWTIDEAARNKVAVPG